MHQPDEGEITWHGEQVEIPTPDAAHRARHRHDVPGARRRRRPDHRGEHLPRSRARARAASRSAPRRAEQHPRAADAGSATRTSSPNTEVGPLSAANKQIVSMARALSHDIKLIIMDEPSAPCSTAKRSRTCSASSRNSPPQGIAVVYISHRLEEIRQIGDRITVLKDGRSMASGLPVADTPTAELIRLMTGRTVENVFPPRRARGRRRARRARGRGPGARGRLRRTSRSRSAPARCRTRRARRLGTLRDPRDHLRRTRSATAGTVTVSRQGPAPGLGASHAVDAGIGLSPEERKSQGLVLEEPIFLNVTLSSMSRLRARRRSSTSARSARPRASRSRRSSCARPTPTGPRDALRRQPAEDPARALAGARHAGAAARRAHPRRRRRRARRDLRAHPPPRRRRATPSSWSPARSKRCSASPTACSSSPTAACSQTLPATEIDEHGVLDLVMKGSAA